MIILNNLLTQVVLSTTITCSMFTKRSANHVLGKLEAEIMTIIWRSKTQISVSDVVKVLTKKRKIAYTTVMTIMGRLLDKGLLVRKPEGLRYLYQPKVSQGRFIEKSVHHIFATTVSSLGSEAVTHFVTEIKKLSPQKRQELLKILDKS